jgi:hypothetical protein
LVTSSAVAVLEKAENCTVDPVELSCSVHPVSGVQVIDPVEFVYTVRTSVSPSVIVAGELKLGADWLTCLAFVELLTTTVMPL